MFVFTDNEQLKRELKKIIIDSGFTQKEIAGILDMKPQQFTNVVKKKNLSFEDVKKIVSAAGYKMQIDFVKEDWYNIHI